MQRGCLLRFLILLGVVAAILVYLTLNSLERNAEEVARCEDEAVETISNSADRVKMLSTTVTDFESGRKEVQSALKTIEDVRASNEAITQVIKGVVADGKCRLEHESAIRVLEIEAEARREAALYVSLLVRSDQNRRSAEQLQQESDDFRQRYRSLKQPHLLTLAENYANQARAASQKADQLSQEGDKHRKAFRSLVKQHEATTKKLL